MGRGLEVVVSPSSVKCLEKTQQDNLTRTHPAPEKHARLSYALVPPLALAHPYMAVFVKRKSVLYSATRSHIRVGNDRKHVIADRLLACTVPPSHTSHHFSMKSEQI